MASTLWSWPPGVWAGVGEVDGIGGGGEHSAATRGHPIFNFVPKIQKMGLGTLYYVYHMGFW